ncbi:MAG: electron transport complex subunit E [Eubacteriales bacterium]
MNAAVKKYLLQFKEGIVDKNPTFVQLLGMCPTLATTTSVSNAVGMGLAATAVLCCSNLFISLLRRFIPREVRIASFIVIISGFVSAVEMLIKAFLPALDASLGVFIPLIVVNCIILARAEAFASKNPPLPSFFDGLSMGLGFTLALCCIAAVRELLGSGSILGFNILGSSYPGMLIFIMPSGAFLTLGCLVALVNKLRAVAASHSRSSADTQTVTADSPAEASEISDETASGEVKTNSCDSEKSDENTGTESDKGGEDK